MTKKAATSPDSESAKSDTTRPCNHVWTIPPEVLHGLRNLNTTHAGPQIEHSTADPAPSDTEEEEEEEDECPCT